MYIGPWQELKLGQMLSENTRYIKQTIHTAVCAQRQAEAENFNAQVFANGRLAIEPPKLIDPYDHTLTLLDNCTLPPLRPPTPLVDRLVSRLEQYPPRSPTATAQPQFISRLYPPFGYDRPLSVPRLPTPPSLPFLLPTTSTDTRLAIIRTPSSLTDSDNNVASQLMPDILSPLLSLPSIYSYLSPDIERRKQREKRSEKKKAERVRLNEMHQQRMQQLQLMWLNDQKRLEEEYNNRLKLDVLNLNDHESAAKNNLVFMRHCNEAATKASAHFYFPVLSKSEHDEDDNNDYDEVDTQQTARTVVAAENGSQTSRTDMSRTSTGATTIVKSPREKTVKPAAEDEEEKRHDELVFRHHLTSSMPSQPSFCVSASNRTLNRPFNPNSKENTSGARSITPTKPSALTVPSNDSFGIIPENAHDEEADELVAWTNRLSMELESYWD